MKRPPVPLSKLVVIGAEADPHVGRTCMLLRELGQIPLVVAAREDSKVSIALDRPPYSFEVNGHRIAERDVLWVRPKYYTGSPFLDSEPIPGESALGRRRRLNLAMNLWNETFQLLQRFHCGPFVNPPWSMQQARLKPVQQFIASNLGFSVPPSLVSNSAIDILQFIRLHGQAIAKAVGDVNVLDAEAAQDSLPLTTMLVGEEDLRNWEGPFGGPILVQKYIEKAHELRVFATPQEVRAFQIDSQGCELTKVDWRLGTSFLSFPEVRLCDRVTAMTQEFLKFWGLSYGSFDFIVSPDGTTWFLECNSDGQWAWLEPEEDPFLSRMLATQIQTLL
jgi:hypothetical protein